MKIFDFFRFKVLAGKPQRVLKNTALSLLAVACMFLRAHNFGSVLALDMVNIVKLLESNVLICFLKITTADLRKIGLKIWE